MDQNLICKYPPKCCCPHWYHSSYKYLTYHRQQIIYTLLQLQQVCVSNSLPRIFTDAEFQTFMTSHIPSAPHNCSQSNERSVSVFTCTLVSWLWSRVSRICVATVNTVCWYWVNSIHCTHYYFNRNQVTVCWYKTLADLLRNQDSCTQMIRHLEMTDTCEHCKPDFKCAFKGTQF